MTKQSFLDALRQRLQGLSPDDMSRSLEFYGEAIDDRMEDGLSEEDAVAAVGTVDEIVAQILRDTPLVRLVKTTVRPRRALRAWEIVLLVLGSPVWLPLLVAVACILLALYLVLWVLVIALFAVCAALFGGALGGLAAAAVFLPLGHAASALFMAGGGLVLLGLAILTVMVSASAVKGVVALTRKGCFALKARLIRKGDAA